jgi:hypothetical protein
LKSSMNRGRSPIVNFRFQLRQSQKNRLIQAIAARRSMHGVPL